MPILDLEIILRPDELLAPGLAGDIADRCGEVFGSAPGNTWIKLRTVPREHYAENGGGPPEGVDPVFVSVLKARLPAPEALSAEVARLTAAIARTTGRQNTSISSTCQQGPAAWHSGERYGRLPDPFSVQGAS